VTAAAAAHAQSIEGRPIWDALQIEHLILDEAHFAKSLGTTTRMEHVSGLPTGESARAVDCWAKCQTVMRSGGRVTALSGTPLTNSLAEAHVWMRMLQPRLLAHVGLTRFDDWASVFAEAVPIVEMDCVGRFRSQTRLRFRNVPELLKLLGECWDFAGSVETGLDIGNETVKIGV
jgi:N12 class adenine-specific DNA methylase